MLLGRRHEGHVFMPGKFVFPGGRVEAADASMPSASELDPQGCRQIDAGHEREESARAGARRRAGDIRGNRADARREEQARHRTRPAACGRPSLEAGVYPDLAALHFVARAITPPGLPRRFDTRFFAVDAQAIAHRVDGIVGPQAELVELVWVPLAETKDLGLHAITAVILEELQARAAAGMGHDLPVPFYRMKNGRFVRELL